MKGYGVEAWFGRGELGPLAQTAALSLQEGSCTVELQYALTTGSKNGSTGLGGCTFVGRSEEHF